MVIVSEKDTRGIATCSDNGLKPPTLNLASKHHSQSSMFQDISYPMRVAALDALESLGISKKRPSKQHKKWASHNLDKACKSKKAVFKVPLPLVVENHGYTTKDGLRVPRFMAVIDEKLRAGNLGLEGLFRVNGSASVIKKLKAEVDGGNKDVDGPPHALAGLCKLYLRELPEPLMTYRLYEMFVEAHLFSVEKTKRIRAALLVCLQLGDSHLHTLRHLMLLLHDVSKAGGKMTPQNLASIFTPNILKPPTDPKSFTTSETELRNHGSCVKIVELLIENAGLIGYAPPDIMESAKKYQDKEARKMFTAKMFAKQHWWNRKTTSDTSLLEGSHRQSNDGEDISRNALQLLNVKRDQTDAVKMLGEKGAEEVVFRRSIRHSQRNIGKENRVSNNSILSVASVTSNCSTASTASKKERRRQRKLQKKERRESSKAAKAERKASIRSQKAQKKASLRAKKEERRSSKQKGKEQKRSIRKNRKVSDSSASTSIASASDDPTGGSAAGDTTADATASKDTKEPVGGFDGFMMY